LPPHAGAARAPVLSGPSAPLSGGSPGGRARPPYACARAGRQTPRTPRALPVGCPPLGLLPVHLPPYTRARLLEPVPDPRGPAPVTLGAPYGDDDLSGEPRRIPRLVGSWGSRAAKCVTGPRHLSQRDRGRHRAERAPWRDAHLPPGFPALCAEREPGRVRYAPRELRQQAVVPERVAGASPGDLHPRTPPPQEPTSDFRPRVRGRALRALPVGGRTKIRLAEGFETQLQRPLPYALAKARTLELADFAVALRDLDHPVGWRVRGSGSPLVPSGR
jgi:hypothetical protein